MKKLKIGRDRPDPKSLPFGNSNASVEDIKNQTGKFLSFSLKAKNKASTPSEVIDTIHMQAN